MKSKHKLVLITALAILVPFTWLTTLRLLTFKGAENSTDCFYHVTVAERGPGVYTAKTFPKMTLSIWQNQFYDKELLFHFSLSLVRKLAHALVPDSDRAPFHLSALVFTFLFITSFVITARYFRVPWIVYLSLLMVVIAPFFTQRILMLRPHLLSMSLILLSCICYHRYQPGKRDNCLVFALAFVFSWSYSNPHFLLLPAVAFAIAGYQGIGKRIIWMPLLTLLGLITGFIVHPQFPNTFINWKIQCVDVPIQSVLGNSLVTLGHELRGPDLNWLMLNSLFIILGCANLVVALILTRKKTFAKLSPAFRALMILAVIFFLGMFLGIRSIEYACPFNIIFTGLIINEIRNSKHPLPQWLWNRFRPFQLIALLVALSLAMAEIQYYFRNDYVRRVQLTELPAFVNANIPTDSVIANLVWSDFPFLYNALPQYRFLYGLDPMFAYAVNPQTVQQLDQFRRGKLNLTPQQLRDLVKTRYVYVGPYFALGKYMVKKGFKSLYSGRDGWLFDLGTTERTDD